MEILKLYVVLRMDGDRWMMILIFWILGLITWRGYLRYSKDNNNDIMVSVGVVLLILCVIPLIILLKIYSAKFSLDDNIALYESQNQIIQEDLNEIVSTYMMYESNAFDHDVSPIVLVETYPELKSNELILRQIDVYVKNNNRVMILKEEKNNLKIIGWWLFFNIGVNYD